VQERPFCLVVIAAVTGVVALLFTTGLAGASDPSPLVLDWQGPRDCQAAPRVIAEVGRLLGAEHAGESLVVRAKVERTGKRWHLVLSTQHRGRAVARTLDAESCDAAADAAAVILALTIDPSRALLGSPEDEKMAGDARDAGPSPADAADERVPVFTPQVMDAGELDARPDPHEIPEGLFGEDAGASRFGFALSAAALSDTGTLPRGAIGFAGGFALGVGPIWADATFAYYPPVDTTVSLAPARGGSFSMFAGTLQLCALASGGALSVGPCAGVGMTRMHAEAFGVSTPIAADSTWGNAAVDALARVRISRYFSLRLNAGVSIPFARPVFEVQGLGSVHQPSAIALQMGAGGEVHF
jgi:hypothetical protein